MMATLKIIAADILFFVIGIVSTLAIYPYLCPTTKIYHNIDEHTTFNHGQITIDVDLPPGVKFTSFGDCGPYWKDDGKGSPYYWNSFSLNVEKYDQKTNSFAPKGAPANTWIEMVR